MKARRWIIAAILAAALLLLAGRAIAGIYVDFQWYAAMGAVSVWREKALAWFAVRGTSAVIASLFLFANLYAVRHSVVSLVLPRRVGNIEIGEEVPGRYLVAGAAILALILGALLTLRHEPWSAYTLAREGVEFGERDPYFDHDLGFFVAWLPFEQAMHIWALITVLLTAAVVIFLYALTPSLRWERGTLYMSMYVQRHLIVLGALLMMVLAWSYRLDGYELLLSEGARGAFGYADHRAALPATTWLSFLTVIAALIVAWFGWTGQLRIAFGAIGVLFILALLLRQGGPPLVKQLATTQDPVVRERPYLATRAEYTRRAFGLERITRADSGIALANLRTNVRAISLWDPAALVRAVTRQRHVPSDSTTVGWSAARGELVSTVPLRPAGDEDDMLAWGAQRVLVGTVDSRGEPVAIASGADGRESIELPRVLVYNGATGARIVADSSMRIPAPALETSGARLAHAWSRQNFRLLGGDLPRPTPRLVDRRDVRLRVRALAPFFAQGTVIAPLVALDSLFWAIELYSASGTYPLSDRVRSGGSEYSYLKHSATAIVNAHTGRVILVADSARDPIAERWATIFPRLFRRWSEVPPAIARSLPPAADAAHAQAVVLARYGLRGEALRGGELPLGETTDTALARENAPQLALPLQEPAVAWSETVLDGTKHVAGVIVAVGGRQRATYWIPLDRQGPRWSSGIVDPLRRVLDSTAAVPREARAVRGRIRAVPSGRDLVFIQPLYAWRSDGIPTLARVAVVGPEGVFSGRSLADAIGAPRDPSSDTGRVVGPVDFRARVAELYAQMRDALQRGDWVAFGRAYEQLGALLGREE
ncbi:MAG TPA: UPF0182 family protein [Gemmatimonadaceae bacterium]|nr:UPF0182 family protein [Gemmatimonadaceae bacterium]